EPLHYLSSLQMREVAVGDVGHRRFDQLSPDRLRAFQLALIFHPNLAVDRRQRCVDVVDARNGTVFAIRQRASFGVRDDIFHCGDRKPLADTRSFVDESSLSALEGDLLNDLGDKGWNVGPRADAIALGPRLLRSD